MLIERNREMKLQKSKKDKELYYYYNIKGEKRWMFRHKYYNQLGKRTEIKRQGFHTEKKALQTLVDIKADTIRGNFKQVEFSNYTIAQWFDTWYGAYNQNWKISTRTQRESAIRLHIKPLLGGYKLSDLKRTTYQEMFINKLLENKKTSTVETLHNIFKIGINSAVEEEIISRNRFTKLKIHNKDEKDIDVDTKMKDSYLEVNELIILLDKAKGILNITNYTLLLVLAYTGLRKGEGHGLRWKDIDLENQTITILRTRDNKGVRPPKTKNSYRTIDLDKSVVVQLKK